MPANRPHPSWLAQLSGAIEVWAVCSAVWAPPPAARRPSRGPAPGRWTCPRL